MAGARYLFALSAFISLLSYPQLSSASGSCGHAYATVYVTELMNFENDAFINNKGTFHFDDFSSRKDKISDTFIKRFTETFGQNRAESRRSAGTVISLSSELSRRGMTGHATYAAPVERAFSVGVCHMNKYGIKPDGSITYECSWKFYEVNNLCAAESKVIDFIIRNVKTRETSTVKPHSSTRPTVRYEIHPAI